jgi:hypothetical protein
MGPGETIGLIAVVVLLIVVIGVAASAYERRLKHKERKLELEAQIASAGGAQGTDTAVRQLEARVRVLERIATDRGQIASAELAAQIEDLRAATRTQGEPV